VKFIRIQYNGRKPYRDRTSLRINWMPGDKYLVSPNDAKTLLRFAEFSEAEAAPESDAVTDEQVVASTRQQEAEAKVKEEHDQKESILTMVEVWDKNELEAYARENYSVELDKRRSVAALRQEVSLLVEQFGAR
jgi:hypothetical protein